MTPLFRYAKTMPDPTWAPPIQSLDIAPEKKPRLPWLNARTFLTLSIIGYALDFLNGTPGKIFNLIGLIGLIAGFVTIVENMVESGIHRKWNKRQLLLGWLLLVAAVLVGLYI